MSELSKHAKKLIEEELARHKKAEDPLAINDPLFPAQNRFVQDKALFLAALCTRRAGKSNGLALRFIRTMKKYPGSLCRYISLTRDSAKDIMWPVLVDMNERFKLNAELTESNLTMTLPNGARLRLYGADMKNFIRRLRGAKSPGTALDECQEFGDHITTLVDDIIVPSMADYSDGWLALTGTPGPIPRGLFYDVTAKGLGDYSVHRWSLYENPYLPDPRGFVERLKVKKQWDERNPTYLREYQGQWVLDLESLLIRWDKDKNDYQHLPPENWVYILGVDIGHRDADALAVLAWSDRSKQVYLVEELLTTEQDITELSGQIKAMQAKYDIAKIVMDEGGLGKKAAEEIRRRHHIPVHPAEKQRKMENVAFLNEALRLGHFKARSASRFVQDSFQVQLDYEKSTPDRLVVKKGFHSDIIDAVLYAFKESPAWAWQATPPAPAYGSPEWAQEQVIGMERSTMERLQREAEDEDGLEQHYRTELEY